MLYSIYGGANHPKSKLHANSHEACRDAMYKGMAYQGDFSADEFNQDDFYFIDVIESSCVPVFNAKFKSACDDIAGGAIQFQPVELTWGGENLLEWVGDQIKGFYTAKPAIVDIIDENLTPMRFWPKLKKFKHEDFVITQSPPDELGIFVDLKRPHLLMFSEKMKTSLEGMGISASFRELPVAL